MKKALIITCNDSYDYGTRTRYVEMVLKEKGYSVEHLLSDFDHRRKKRYKADRQGVIHYISVPEYSKNLSTQRIWSHIRFGQQAKKFVMEGDYDLIYHCAPPNYTIKQLEKCKEKKEFKLITEIGDMWPESIPIGDGLKRILKIPFGIWSGLRDKHLNNSDAIIAECDLFRDTIIKNSGIDNVQTLYFCKEYMGSERTITYHPGDGVSLCYLGSINNIIDIEMIGKLIEAMVEAEPVILHIIGDGENRQSLIEAGEKAGAEVHFHGIVFDEKKKKEVFNQCHFALNIMKPEVFVGMTMKSLDYFSYGVPIINNIAGDVWKMVDQERLGYNVIDNEHVDAVIRRITDICSDDYQEMCHNIYRCHTVYFSYSSFAKKMSSIITE